VGFVLEDYTWLGGVNYYRNLFSALSLLPNSHVEPILFLGSNAPTSVTERLQFCKIVKTDALNRRSASAIFRKGIRKLPGRRDFYLGAILARHKIDILSHAADMRWRSDIRTIGWIPDFQHLHIPSFFSTKELKQRDREYARIALHCDRIVLSSKSAQSDFARIAPQAVPRSRILRFVPEIDLELAVRPFAPLTEKFRIDREYFFLPNQFWIHKNHGVVVEALGILKNRGLRPVVLATGHTTDPRSRDHFAALIARITELDVKESFRVLGVIPYGDMVTLMKHSIAVINPSLFEGWSSTVEEAKILDKTVILSDLPVHREQNPQRAIFFDPSDAESLANAMLNTMHDSPQNQPINDEQALAYNNARRQFGAQYEEVVVEVMSIDANRRSSSPPLASNPNTH
jgi:glycosyltransferase involved in cell wall biosynthesis